MLTTRKLARAYCCCLLALQPSETLFATLPFIFHASPFYISKLPRSLSVALQFSLAPSPPTTIFSSTHIFLVGAEIHLYRRNCYAYPVPALFTLCFFYFFIEALCSLHAIIIGQQKMLFTKKILSTLIAHKLLVSRSIHLICKTVIKKVLNAPLCQSNLSVHLTTPLINI